MYQLNTMRGIFIKLAVLLWLILGFIFYNSGLKREFIEKRLKNEEVGKKTSFEIYKNTYYGFEIRYPSGWRFKPQKSANLLKQILGKEAKATTPFRQDLEAYGIRPVFELWFQNPAWDMKPVLESVYSEKPQYYQYSFYNGAPLGIFIYIFENDWRYSGEEENAQKQEIVFNGRKAYRIKFNEDSNEGVVWANEKIEVENSGRLYLIFYAGKNYQSEFENLILSFRFLP